jgi:hypothetical protein
MNCSTAVHLRACINRVVLVALRTSRFGIKKLYLFHHTVHCVSYVHLRTNSDYFPVQHLLICFCILAVVCLLCGTNFIFK